MKRRKGFVANSSSSSFVFHLSDVKKENRKKVLSLFDAPRWLSSIRRTKDGQVVWAYSGTEVSRAHVQKHFDSLTQ